MDNWENLRAEHERRSRANMKKFSSNPRGRGPYTRFMKILVVEDEKKIAAFMGKEVYESVAGSMRL